MGVLVVRVAVDEADACSDWLFQLGATAIEERDSEPPTLVAGFGDDDLALAARSVLSERWPCRLESTGEEAAWRDEWLKWIEPVAVAGFVVHAPWHDPADWPEGQPELSIDPGRAFGSGHHPTTQLALEALQQAVTPHTHVLDVGCGTGILSIAAAKLGAESVLGVDLDYDIIEVAAANAEANGVGDIVELRTEAVADVRGDFDIAIANIVIGDLEPLMPAIVDRAQEGVVIISGFLDEHFERLLADIDVRVLARSARDEWSCATLAPT